MGIVLIRDQKNQSFYVHEVLTIAEGATPFKTGTVKTNGDTGGEAPSVLSILQKFFLSTLLIKIIQILKALR